MTKLELEDFEFRETNKKIKFIFMKYYYFLVDKIELKKIGLFSVNKDFIEFETSDKTMTNKINRILKIGLDNLTNILGKKTIYIHKDRKIPLIGTNEFGIVDRDTNIIEVKAHTLCNLDCIYCSVDAGKSSRKTNDFVVEPEYLIEEFNKLSSTKKHPVEAQINPQGEPLMYSRIIDLVKGLKVSNNVKTVTINTNGSLLTENLIDELIKAGLNRINLSLNTINQTIANKLAGQTYPLEKVKKIIKYCNNKIDFLIAPLIVPSFNEEGIKELIEFCKENKITRFGFQNFLTYKRGRNPAKPKPMSQFIEMLEKYEKKTNVKLVNKAEDYGVKEDKTLLKPFKKGDIINAKIVCQGKYPKEFIAVANDRCITVSGNTRTNSRLKIVRDKHNIFRAVII